MILPEASGCCNKEGHQSAVGTFCPACLAEARATIAGHGRLIGEAKAIFEKYANDNELTMTDVTAWLRHVELAHAEKGGQDE